jgi:hypothetical protein
MCVFFWLNMYTNLHDFSTLNLKGKDNMEVQDIDGGTVLKWLLEK